MCLSLPAARQCRVPCLVAKWPLLCGKVVEWLKQWTANPVYYAHMGARSSFLGLSWAGSVAWRLLCAQGSLSGCLSFRNPAPPAGAQPELGKAQFPVKGRSV
ncbi:hypothetical protein KIL84_021465 [Mauremys mutica]|uniref:Uncharacterized protein n=1 Tax=Mauremys mutica TaxID=74926 RepID=A0A9D4AZX4_9SAUR|nr:hypothetical protein KIL84_021465 [Mauremys mutica]